MTFTLHLGVVDIPYTSGPVVPRRIVFRRRGDGTTETFTAAAPGQETTGDVATFLEEKYHLIELFVRDREQKIADDLATAYEAALEDLLVGGPVGADPAVSVEAAIETDFKINYISKMGVEAMGIPGVPTKAALEGYSARLKKRTGARRPSFRDTGLFESSFKVWHD